MTGERLTLGQVAELPVTLTPAEAFRVLGVGSTRGWRSIAEGEIPTVRLGRRVLVPTAALLASLGLEVSTALARGESSPNGQEEQAAHLTAGQREPGR